MAPSSTAFRFNLISDEERAALLKLGAVGDCCSISMTATASWSTIRSTAASCRCRIEQLRSVPTRVIASGGNDKVDCLLGAIRLIDCNVLITNEATARELLLRKP